MVGHKVLCVAEKNSIAKAVALHLGGTVQTSPIRGNQFVKNYSFDYHFGNAWGQCSVTCTSVAGHLTAQDFPAQYAVWAQCDPHSLFDAPIEKKIPDNNKSIAENIKRQAASCSVLFIWTDCDREGEHIGSEIRDLALGVNRRLEVKRAHFSNVERNHIIQAARNPVTLDERQASAVKARIEIDLRTGAAFTRILTLSLKPMVHAIQPDLKAISYGSCQFPTLGFVVDRYFKVQRFVPEPYWGMKLTHKKENLSATFTWARGPLFDRMAVVILYERCLLAKRARVVKMTERPTSKWRPLPLTTVELQKNASRFLGMNSQRAMKVAEDLYTKGWISYPRTETDQFDKDMDLRALVQKQTQDGRWGQFANGLLAGGFQFPRSGSHNDKAHPPIHPVNYVAPTVLNPEEKKVYEFVVRRFLACCAQDARGELTQIEALYGTETFKASGLKVIARNYLDVYPYERWNDSSQLPAFREGEEFVPTEAKMTDGMTRAPGYLTEPELIALMDANGIGTDATMAEHIAKIKERKYVQTRPRSGIHSDSGSDDGHVPADRGRGRGNGRGRGRGRGGNSAAGPGRSSRGVDEFIPTTLGVALIEGYENLEFETSLSKPFLRKEAHVCAVCRIQMELQMKAICNGQRTREDVVRQNIEQYRAVYQRTRHNMGVLRSAVQKYVLGGRNGTG